MVAVVGVGQRMGEHDGRHDAAEDLHQLVGELGALEQRVVPRVEELDLRAQSRGGPLGLGPTHRLDLLEGLAGQPLARGLAALAEGEADDHGAIAPLDRGRDGAGRPPDEVACVGAHDQYGPGLGALRLVAHRPGSITRSCIA